MLLSYQYLTVTEHVESVHQHAMVQEKTLFETLDAILRSSRPIDKALLWHEGSVQFEEAISADSVASNVKHIFVETLLHMLLVTQWLAHPKKLPISPPRLLCWVTLAEFHGYTPVLNCHIAFIVGECPET